VPYQVDWEIPQSVLRVQLTAHVTLPEFVEVNRMVTDKLNTVSADAGIALMVNVNEALSVPQAFNQLRLSQTYATSSNSRLKYILIVCGNNRLMRLMMLLTFNLCRPSLQFFDTPAQALTFIRNMNDYRARKPD
jgi:hypothetical protein